MDTIVEILLRSSKITTVIVGISGLVLSLALVFSNDAVRRISAVLNRQFKLGLPSRDLNRQVSLDTIFGWFPTLSGTLIAGASLAILVFLFLAPMPSYTGKILVAIGFESMSWLARFAALLGLVFGLLLVFSPDHLKRINQVLNRWHDTDAVIRKMEDRVVNFDALVLNNPRISGTIGVIMSSILLILTLGINR